MIRRFIPLLLLGSSFLIPLPVASAAPTIQLIVPSYDYTPGHAFSTTASDISNNRMIVGSYFSNQTEESGYIRFANCRFSRPIMVAGATFTTVYGINNAGLVCGTFISDTSHGFFFDGTTYTQFDLPGNVGTIVTGENDAGDFVGVAFDAQGVETNFISIGGVITTFAIPGSTNVSPTDINNLGQVTGHYSQGPEHGFFRDADGTLTYPIDYPVAGSFTEIQGLNDQGLLVGVYFVSGGALHGFVLQNLSRFLLYDHPDGSGRTVFEGINNSNMICGYYSDPTGFQHSFLARLAASGQ